MSRIVAVAGGFIQDKAVDALYELVKDRVIGRWSEHRAKSFFESFLDEVRKEKDVRSTSAELNDLLGAVANSEAQTSAIFDAYRRVALSASKDIGPMVIGLLTARIVLEDRSADEIEEMAFQGAEVLNDRDFASLLAWMERFVHSETSYSSQVAQQKKWRISPLIDIRSGQGRISTDRDGNQDWFDAHNHISAACAHD